jgi:hypothetical protein
MFGDQKLDRNNTILALGLVLKVKALKTKRNKNKSDAGEER